MQVSTRRSIQISVQVFMQDMIQTGVWTLKPVEKSSGHVWPTLQAGVLLVHFDRVYLN